MIPLSALIQEKQRRIDAKTAVMYQGKHLESQDDEGLGRFDRPLESATDQYSHTHTHKQVPVLQSWHAWPPAQKSDVVINKEETNTGTIQEATDRAVPDIQTARQTFRLETKQTAGL